MSPYAGQQLIEIVLPMLRAAIPRCVRPAAGEDKEELVQDGCAIAARMLDAAEAAGQVLRPRSVVFYVLQRLKSGRRSGYAGDADAMSAAAEVRGKVRRSSFDEPVTGEDGEAFTLHDLLDDQGEDPASAAGRTLDWAELGPMLNDREHALVAGIATGTSRTALARQFRVSCPRVSQIARGLATRIQHEWGPDIVATITTEPRFRAGIHASRERSECRAMRTA